MPAGRRWLVYFVALGLWGTGVAWLYAHYFLQTPGPFGATLNSSEPWWLKLHGAFAFAALWTFGFIWGVHVVKGWGAGRRRWSGSLFIAVLLLLVVSAYLLYYLGDEGVRSAVSIAHWAVGLACPLLFLLHHFGPGEKRGKGPRGVRPKRPL
jgi:hypothetical protein